MWFTVTKKRAEQALRSAASPKRSGVLGNGQCFSGGANGKHPSKNTITGEPYTAVKLLKEAVIVFGTFSIWAFTLAFIDDMIKLGVL